jgi:serine phosphatase RsbU (regulator of sigma subunit)
MTLDLATLDVELSVAGPPGPLLFRSGTCAPMTGTFGWTLGYPFDQMAYDLQRFTLRRGDVVVFYTDGLSEASVAAASNPDASETEALSAIVCEVAAAGGDRIAARLFEKLESADASIFNDDATALALRIR